MLTYAYDNLNRVIRKIVPERAGLAAIHTRDVYYDYIHALGLQTKARFDGLDGYGVTHYYDQFGQPTTTLLTMDGQPGQYRYVSYYHDDAGNLWRLTHPDGANFYYNRDALGRVTSLLDGPSTSLDDYVARYWYNAAGNRSGIVRGAGTGGFTTIFYRDPIERPTVIANDLPGAGDNPIELAYNPASQITSRAISNDSYVWTGAYNVSRAYAVNGLNQYTSAGPASFTYDANGNLTSDGTTSYVYDVENRLVGASNGASLAYDPLGRLVQVSSPGGASTSFYYDGDKIIAEYDGSGAMTKRYVHGPGADEPVAVYEGPALGLANRRYTMQDERGSIVALVNANGSPSVYNTYDSWGIPGAGNAGRFQYTGQAWIAELGMYHYKARIYSPTLGRFLQTDPIGYKDQMNLYAYVRNDPINATDPGGLGCNTERTRCWSDNYRPGANSVNVRHNQKTDAVVRSSMNKFQNPVGSGMRDAPQREPNGVTVRGKDGSESVRMLRGSGRNSDGADKQHVRVPAGATSVIHGHLKQDGGGRTLVDDPSANRGWGDAASLGLENPVPTYTVAGNRLGVHDAPAGHVQFEMIQGAMTKQEMIQIQHNLDIQQRTLDESSPE